MSDQSILWGWPVASWDRVGFWLMMIGAALGVVALLASLVSSVVLNKVGNIAQAELRTANLALEKQATEAARDIARSQERIAELNKQTEELHAKNLTLQEAIQPRRLGLLITFWSPDDPEPPNSVERQFRGIKAFAGTPLLIQVVPDFEAQSLARDIVRTVQAFGWKPEILNESISRISPLAIQEGIMVTFPPNSKFGDAAQALADAFSNAGLSGPTRWSNGRLFAQGYPVNPDGAPAKWPGYPDFEKPIDAVIVLVGMKPAQLNSDVEK